MLRPARSHQAIDVQGFVVAAWEERRTPRGGPPRLFATGRLEDGHSFAVVLPVPDPELFVAPEDASLAGTLLGIGAHLDAAPWSELDGSPLARLTFPVEQAGSAERLLSRSGIPVVHAERPRASDALLARGITGPVSLRGVAVPGRRVDAVFIEPELVAGTRLTPLSWLALDIETDRSGHVVAVSLAGAGGPGEVLFLGRTLDSSFVTSYRSECELLSAFAERLRRRDPDVLTGWNVVDFDLRVLARRFAACDLPFDIGRTAGAAQVRDREGRRTFADVPGRAVLDAMRLVRAGGERLEEQSLDAVAHALLREGKSVALRGDAKLDELDRLRRDDPAAFCGYCLRDSELVLRILAKTGLDALTQKRAALTGVPLDLAWTSIPAFERLYGARLRGRRIVPPPPRDEPVAGAAGGTVLAASAGLFRNVLVFDFRSLYPSLMRTFHIDPLAHARAQAAPSGDDLVAPNGARFTRDPGLLPDVIERYALEREAALAAGDETGAYVYKILQNSFYGVLGSSGCRYARTELAGAITGFGKLFLTAARDWFEERGHPVLYGDTDSVFVRAPCGEEIDAPALGAFGRRLADELNDALSSRVQREYGVASHLRIRCEKVYRRFLIPRLKGDDAPEGRGRGKGYAGLRLEADGTAQVEIRGMEAVRSDFTPLARRFQRELLERLFADADDRLIARYCRDVVARLGSGELDAELVYRRFLRRPANAYEAATPQVRAARQLGWTDRRGRIDFVMTTAGPEPVEARSGAPLDHAHYRDRQLLPIARALADVLGADAEAWFGAPRQLELFGRP